MAFCPQCDNDTLMEGLIYTSEDGMSETCYDHCDYCGYHEDYDCENDEDMYSLELGDEDTDHD